VGDSQSGGSTPCCRCCRGLLCVATFVSGRFAIRWGSRYLVAGVAEGCCVLQYSVVRGCIVSVLYLLLSLPFTTACLCVMGCLIFTRHFPWKPLQLVANLLRELTEARQLTSCIILPKSTTSRDSDSSVSRGTNPNWDFALIWICAEEFEFLGLVDSRV